MLILHTSDWHVGRTVHRADLTPAFEAWCRHVVALVRDREVDAVLISGDVYDRGVPPTSAVALFDRTLAELAESTTVVVTAGNHDSPQRLGFGSALMRENVHIRTDARMSGQPVEIRDRAGRLGALVYPIPYLDPDVERVNLAGSAGGAPNVPGAGGEPQSAPNAGGEPFDALARSHEAVLRAALGLVAGDIRRGVHAGVDLARIVMAHAFVTGGEASGSERDISVGGVDAVPSSLFRLGEEGPGPLSYVALGHLHSPQRVGKAGDPPMRYSGSPVAFSFSETAAKSSVLLRVNGSQVEEELVPAPVWRRMVTVEGTLDRIERTALPEAEKAFVRAIVTDPDRPADMAARIQRAFPHVLEIQHRFVSREGDCRQAEISAMDPARVLELFMEASGNRPLTSEESSLLAEVWESVRSASNREVRS